MLCGVCVHLLCMYFVYFGDGQHMGLYLSSYIFVCTFV